MRPGAMLEEVDALPGAEYRRAVEHWNADRGLRQRGLDVPGRVAVVGYDDIQLASYFHPPLTTVQQPIQEAGRALVAALLELTEGRPAPSQQLPTQLIVRHSTV